MKCYTRNTKLIHTLNYNKNGHRVGLHPHNNTLRTGQHLVSVSTDHHLNGYRRVLRFQ